MYMSGVSWNLTSEVITRGKEIEWVTPVVSEEYLFVQYQLSFPTPFTLYFFTLSNRKMHYCLYVIPFLTDLLAGTDKNDSADKVAEKLEELSVKEESKESEKKETKEKTEEKQ